MLWRQGMWEKEREAGRKQRKETEGATNGFYRNFQWWLCYINIMKTIASHPLFSSVHIILNHKLKSPHWQLLLTLVFQLMILMMLIWSAILPGLWWTILSGVLDTMRSLDYIMWILIIPKGQGLQRLHLWNMRMYIYLCETTFILSLSTRVKCTLLINVFWCSTSFVNLTSFTNMIQTERWIDAMNFICGIYIMYTDECQFKGEFAYIPGRSSVTMAFLNLKPRLILPLISLWVFSQFSHVLWVRLPCNNRPNGIHIDFSKSYKW